MHLIDWNECFFNLNDNIQIYFYQKYPNLFEKVRLLTMKERLSENRCAINILENNPKLIDWYCLSNNKNAIHLLEKNIDKIDWSQLSGNITPTNI